MALGVSKGTPSTKAKPRSRYRGCSTSATGFLHKVKGLAYNRVCQLGDTGVFLWEKLVVLDCGRVLVILLDPVFKPGPSAGRFFS